MGTGPIWRVGGGEGIAPTAKADVRCPDESTSSTEATTSPAASTVTGTVAVPSAPGTEVPFNGPGTRLHVRVSGGTPPAVEISRAKGTPSSTEGAEAASARAGPGTNARRSVDPATSPGSSVTVAWTVRVPGTGERTDQVRPIAEAPAESFQVTW